MSFRGEFGLDSLHCSQPAGKFKARPNIRFRQRGVIPQNLREGLTGSYRSHDIGHENTCASHHRFAVTNSGIEDNFL